MLVGLGAPVMNIPITDALIREVDIRGIFRYENWWVLANILIITLVVIVFVILFSTILVPLYSFYLFIYFFLFFFFIYLLIYFLLFLFFFFTYTQIAYPCYSASSSPVARCTVYMYIVMCRLLMMAYTCPSTCNAVATL